MIRNLATRLLPAAVYSILAVILAFGFAGSLTPAQKALGDTTPDAAKALFTDKCAACHNLPDPRQLMYTRREWRQTVDEMLYQHGALYNAQTKSGITTDEADEIVAYLAQFAPRPGRPGRMNPGDTNQADVWSTDPLQSRSFPFTSADALADFDQAGGIWKIVPSSAAGEGYLKARPEESALGAPSLIVEKKDAVTGDLDLETQFKLFAAKSAPAVGLVVDYQDSRHFAIVGYDPSTQSVGLWSVADGVSSPLQTAVLTEAPAAGPGGWHTLRIIEHDNGQSVEVWLDYEKRLTFADSLWAPGGRVGLWAGAGTVAAFHEMTLDIYPPLNGPETDQ